MGAEAGCGLSWESAASETRGRSPLPPAAGVVEPPRLWLGRKSRHRSRRQMSRLREDNQKHMKCLASSSSRVKSPILRFCAPGFSQLGKEGNAAPGSVSGYSEQKMQFPPLLECAHLELYPPHSLKEKKKVGNKPPILTSFICSWLNTQHRGVRTATPRRMCFHFIGRRDRINSDVVPLSLACVTLRSAPMSTDFCMS